MLKKARLMSRMVSLAIAASIGATTVFAAGPAAPTLSSPANGSNVGGYQISFKWDIDPDVWYYYLYIAKDLNFSQMVVDTGEEDKEIKGSGLHILQGRVDNG
jgi:hypothetical protein